MISTVEQLEALLPEERPINDGLWLVMNRGNGAKEFYQATIERVANFNRDGTEKE